LIQELKRVLDLRAFFITAEAGYGKTTILLQALSQLDAVGVLVPLREAHRDDAAFLCASVIEGLRGLRAGFGAYTMAAMRAGLDASKLAHALAADLVGHLACS